MTGAPAVEAVIFDWGGTLSVFVEAELVDAWALAARYLAPDHAEELTARMVAVETAFWATTASHQRSTTLGDLLAAATAELHLDVAEALFEEAAVHYLDAWTPHVRHDPDAALTLTALRARGLRLGLLSNTHWPPAFHEHFLQRDGLADLLDARLYTSALPFQKPHPDTFTAAMAALGVDDPRGAVFVGDRPFDDIHGAKCVGMRAVLRPNRFAEPYDVEPDATIAALPELIGLVDGWTARSGHV